MNHQVVEELAHAGEASPLITHEVEQLDTFRLTSTTEIAEEVFLFRLFGKPCFPRRELTTITGAAKSGKTFFTSMAMACGAIEKSPALSDDVHPQNGTGSVLAMERIREEPLKVMWYDTEQSRNTTKEILVNRVGRMIGNADKTPFPDELFYVFNMRAATVKERRDMLGVAIATYRPDIVILDGIADLLTDINDGPKAQELMEQLLHLADEYDCNITTVIHLNRSGEKSNLRGWLGSALMQKSFEVFNCAPIGQGELFSVEMNTSRKYRNDQKLYYRIGGDGIPVMVQHCEQGRDAQGRFTSTVDKTEALNQEYIIRHDDAERSWEWDLRRLFSDAMGNVPSMSSEQLMEAVMKLSHIRQKQYYYRVLDEAVAKGVITKTFDRYKRVTFILSPPR